MFELEVAGFHLLGMNEDQQTTLKEIPQSAKKAMGLRLTRSLAFKVVLLARIHIEAHAALTPF